MKVFIAGVLSLLIFGCSYNGDAQVRKNNRGRTTGKTKNAIQVQPPKSASAAGVQNPKVLAEGRMSQTEKPFICLARDPLTYEALRRRVSELPPANTINFEQTAVVAVFAGERPTPGYGVNITNSNGTIKITATSPPPDAILSQVITSPFKIVAVGVESDQALTLQPDKSWKASQAFSARGTFQMSGGFAGRINEFDLAGSVESWRDGGLITLNLGAVGGKDTKRNRKFGEFASGIVGSNGTVRFERIDAGTMVDAPRSPLKASGTLTDNKLSLVFESLPARVADGFTGSGRLEAVRIVSAK